MNGFALGSTRIERDEGDKVRSPRQAEDVGIRMILWGSVGVAAERGEEVRARWEGSSITCGAQNCRTALWGAGVSANHPKAVRFED